MAGKSKPGQGRATSTDARRTSTNSSAGEARGEEGSSDACDLTIDVDLEGIRPAALTNLKIGDALILELLQSASYPVIVCKKQDGTIVGSLAAFLKISQLVRCLQAGVQYDVRVAQLGSGACRVFGRRK
jgi:hypothetical protein